MVFKKKYIIQGYDIGFFKECNLFENPELEDQVNLKDAKDID